MAERWKTGKDSPWGCAGTIGDAGGEEGELTISPSTLPAPPRHCPDPAQPHLTPVSNPNQTDTRCYLSYRDLIQRTFCCWLYPSHLSADLSHLISHSVQPPRSCSWFVSSSIKPDLIPGNGEQRPFLGGSSRGPSLCKGHRDAASPGMVLQENRHLIPENSAGKKMSPSA